MKVEQIWSILNSLEKDVLGITQYVDANGSAYDSDGEAYTADSPNVTPVYFAKADLSNVVDYGSRLFDNVRDFSTVYASLINHIGRIVYVNRKYTPLIPSLMKDNWEYGSLLEKLDADLPESEINSTWSLIDGNTYNQDKFKSPKGVRVKFFNKGITFEIDMSFTEEQLKQSFSNAIQLNSFFSMIETKIANRLTLDFANLTRSTINAFISATIYSEYSDKYNSSTHKYNFSTADSKVKAVNLLKDYKADVPTADPDLTAETCLKDAEFIRYSAYRIGLYTNRLADISTLFNIGKKTRHTPIDLQHLVLLSDFGKAADVYLQSDTFHEEFTKMPKSEYINYWQGTGAKYDFEDISKIHVVSNVTADGETYQAIETEVSGVIGVLFDNDAMGINNEKQKVTSHYNAKGDFVNNYYKAFGRYFNDHDENCVVFFVA